MNTSTEIFGERKDNNSSSTIQEVDARTKIILLSNDLPKFVSSDDTFKRYIRIIPFNSDWTDLETKSGEENDEKKEIELALAKD